MLVVDLLDVRESFGPSSDEVSTSSKEVAGCSELFRVNVCERKRPSADEASDLFAIDGVRLDFPYEDGSHVESVSENELDLVFLHEICQPIPVEGGLAGDDETLLVGCEGVQEDLGVFALEVLVEQDFPVVVDNADVHGRSVQVDPAVELALLIVEFHHESPWGKVVVEPVVP